MEQVQALDYGLKEDELQPLVNTWKSANPNIVEFWSKVDKAIKKVIKEETAIRLGQLIYLNIRKKRR